MKDKRHNTLFNTQIGMSTALLNLWLLLLLVPISDVWPVLMLRKKH